MKYKHGTEDMKYKHGTGDTKNEELKRKVFKIYNRSSRKRGEILMKQ